MRLLRRFSGLWHRWLFRSDLIGENMAVVTGLVSIGDFINVARVGDHASISVVVNGRANTPMNWSSVAHGENDLGALTVSPLDFAFADTLDPDAPATLYFRDPISGATGVATIRAALAELISPPVIQNSDPAGSDLGDVITMQPAEWSGAVSQSEALFVGPDEVEFPHVVSGDDAGVLISGMSAAVTSGGVATAPADMPFVVDLFVAPAFSSDPADVGAISGNLMDGMTLTYTPAQNVTGNPLPTRSFEVRRASDNSAVSTASSWIAREGEAYYVRETLDNGVGDGISQDSAVSGVVLPFVAPDFWAFSGSLVDAIPEAAGWSFSGSILDNVGDV